MRDSTARYVVEVAVKNCVHFPATAKQLVDLQEGLGLSKEEVFNAVQGADFFKPEGLQKVAKHLGYKGEELEKLEIELGLRKK